MYRAFVFRTSFLFFAARSHRCLKTLLFTAIKYVSMVFNTHCASFYRLSLLRCHLSRSRRQRASATSAAILRLDLAILACHFPSHFHSLVSVLKKNKSFAAFCQFLLFFFTFNLFIFSSPSNSPHDRASECVRHSPKLEQSNKQLLVRSFSSNYPTFTLLLQYLL